MSTGLLIVDFQNDFLPNGALGVPDGHRAQPVISRLARLDEVEVIALSRDWHPANHVSFSNDPGYHDYSWPPHCIQDTEGAEFDEVLIDDLKVVNKPQFVITKGVTNKGDQYSAFEGVTEYPGEPGEAYTPSTVFERIYEVHRIIVVGLALDYCVRMTAIDSVSHGFETVVPVEATRPVAYESGVLAAVQMTNSYVDVTTAADLGVIV
jgi:nicotinamidase/pyrazinamidase